MEYDPIVFINKPTENYSQDVVGFKSQVETIHQAIIRLLITVLRRLRLLQTMV